MIYGLLHLSANNVLLHVNINGICPNSLSIIDYQYAHKLIYRSINLNERVNIPFKRLTYNIHIYIYTLHTLYKVQIIL